MNKRKIWTLCTAVLMIVVFVCALSFTSSADPIEPSEPRPQETVRAYAAEWASINCWCTEHPTTAVQFMGFKDIPSCTEQGMITVCCQEPGCDFTSDYNIPAMNHEWFNYSDSDPAYSLISEGLYFKASTCTSYEHEIKNCIYCGVNDYQSYGNVYDDHALELQSSNAATCTTAGQDSHYKCQYCQQTFEDDEGTIPFDPVIPALGHDFVGGYTEAKDAKCTEDGNVEYYTCQRAACQLKFSSDDVNAAIGTALTNVVLPKLGHAKLYDAEGEELGMEIAITNALFEEIDPATVSATGAFTDGYGFTWTCTQVQTCAAIFKASINCDRCKEDIAFEGINGEAYTTRNTYAAHVFTRVNGDYPKDPSTPECGLYGYKDTNFCANCQKYYLLTADKFCGPEGGKATREESVPDMYVPNNGEHSFGPVGSGVEITSKKCFTPGSERVTCSLCGYQTTKEVPAIGHHSYGDDTYNAGLSTVCYEVWQSKCSVCDDVQTNYQNIEHDKVAVAAKAPTCLENGNVKYWYCADCGEYFKTADNASEEDRYKYGNSDTNHDSVCYDPEKGAFLLATGHDFTAPDAHTVAVAPTCTADGNVEYYTCKNCELNFATNSTTATTALETVVDSKLGHLFFDEKGSVLKGAFTAAVAPKCTEDGNKAYWSCLRDGCGKYFANTVVSEENTVGDEIEKDSWIEDATGHDFNGGHTAAVAPTCTADGNVEYYTCKNCELNFATNDTTAETALETVVDPKTGHTLKYVAETPVTCIADGRREHYKCSTCAKRFEVDNTKTHEADMEALKYSTDGKANLAFLIKATGHILVDVAPVAPTCLRSGNNEYQYCTVCRGCFDELEVPVDNTWNEATKTVRDYALSALGHDFEEVPEVLAKCDADGNKKYYTCNNCGLNFASNENTFDMSGVEGTDAWLLTKEDHIANRTTVLLEEEPTTCGAAGKKAGLKCADCGYIIVAQEEIPALEHDLSEYVYNNDATCTTNGTKTRSCSRCTYSETIDDDAHPATNHAGAAFNAAVAPKCTVDGNVAYYSCEACGKNFAVVDNGDGTFSIGAELATVVDPQTGHDYTEYAAVAPTCQSAGNTAGRACKVCGYHEGYEEIPVDPTAHNYDQIASAATATCVDEGSKDAWKCTNEGCGKYFVEEDGKKVEAEEDSWVIAIDPDNHVNVHYTQAEVPATCTETGLTGEWICRDCQKSQVQEVANALGHDTEKTEAKASTCSVNGNLEYWYCTRCALYFATETGEGEDGAANADAFKLDLDDSVHSFEGAVYVFNDDATCVFNGTETAVCVWCGDETQTRDAEGEANLTEHTWVGVEKVEPTCTEDGTEAYIKCSVCEEYKLGTAEDTVINALGHKFENTDAFTAAEAATCLNDGNVAYWTCDACGAFFANKVDEEENDVADLDSELEADELVIAASAEYHDLEFVEAEAATCYCGGHIAFWHCYTCGKIFADNNGEADLDSELGFLDLWTDIDPSNHLMDLYPEDYIDPDHVRVIANCVQDGCTDAYKCACGATKTCEVEKAYGHTFEHYDEETFCEAGYGFGHIAVEFCTECYGVFAAGTDDVYSTDYLAEEDYELAPTGHVNAEFTPADPCVMAAYWYCADCGNYFTDNNGAIGIEVDYDDLAALAHQNKNATVEAVEEGCLTDGVAFAYFYCNDCGKYFNEATGEEVEEDSWVIPMVGSHDYESSKPAQAPTCTEDGWTEGFKCSRCNAELISEVIPATGHDTVVVNGKEPTCTEIGYDGFYVVCVNCGEVTARAEIVLDPLGHTMTKTDAVVPTCVEGGNVEYWTCETCGLYFATEDGKDATTGEWLEGTDDATVFDLPVNANAHEFTLTAAVEPNCTEGGSIAYNTCELCGKYFDLEGTELEEGEWELAPLGHNDELQTGKPATCFEDGYTSYYKCARCGEETGKEVVPAAHTGVDFTVDPTAGYYATDCVSTGLKSYYQCADCGTYFDGLTKAAVASYDALIIPAHHLYVEVMYVLDEDAPTCTRSGKATTYCYACNTVVAESIDVVPEGHTMTYVEAKEATCVATGNIEYWYCQKCNGYFTTEDGKEDGLFVDALTLEDVTIGINPEAHSVVTDAAVAAGCETTGLTEGSHCELCNTVFVAQEEVPALGHDVVTDAAKDATCTEKGKTEGSHCARCEKVLVEQYDVDALGHNYEWNETVPVTCVTDGSREGVCAACGDTKTEEVKATGHILADHDGKDSTCSVAGCEAWVECATCGRKFVEGTTDVFSTDYIKAPAAKELAAHDFENVEWVADYENKKYTRACKACGFVEEKAMDVEDYSAELKLTVDNAIVPGATLVDSTTAKVTVSLETAGAYLNNISFKFTYDAEKFAYLGYKIVNANIKYTELDVYGKDGVVTAFLTAEGLEDVMFSGEALVEVYFTVICDEKADDVEFNFVEGSYKLLNEEFKTIETEVKNATCDIALFLDVNNDGVVDGADLAMTKAMAENDEYNAAVDINKNGEIDVNDYMNLLRYYLGKLEYEDLVNLSATADED